MEIKINSIVRVKGTNQVFEVINIIGTMAYCEAVTSPELKGATVPFKLSELEVLMEEESDAFNLLFRSDDGEGS